MARVDLGVLRRATAVLAFSSIVTLILTAPHQELSAYIGLFEGGSSSPSLGVDASPLEMLQGRWIELQAPDGMRTAYLSQPGSKMIGLRGNAIVDHHISSILNVFLNTTLSKEWISFLDHVEEHPTKKRNKHIIYQFFDMPWPLGDREFLMERAVEVDKKAKVVTARYNSIDSPIKPQRKNVVRGETQNTFWRFKSLGDRRTEIHVESQLYPKLPISTAVVNFMQSSYQRSSLLQMIALVKDALPHPDYMHW